MVREVAPPPRQRCREDRRPNSASTGCQSVRDAQRTTTKRAGTTTSRSLVGDNNDDDDDDIAWSARDGLLSCGMDVTTAPVSRRRRVGSVPRSRSTTVSLPFVGVGRRCRSREWQTVGGGGSRGRRAADQSQRSVGP